MITEAKQLPLWYRQQRAPNYVQPTLGLDGLDVDSTKPKRRLTPPADAGLKPRATKSPRRKRRAATTGN